MRGLKEKKTSLRMLFPRWDALTGALVKDLTSTSRVILKITYKEAVVNERSEILYRFGLWN